MNDPDKRAWSCDGVNILSSDNLSAIQHYLEKTGNIAVEHWHYYGGKAPTPLAFDDYEKFVAYLKENVQPGDAIDVFPFPTNRECLIASGKYPDNEGRVPKGGSY